MSIILVRNNIMSRLKKYTKKRCKVIYRGVFICWMILITAISVCIIDYEVNKMLGNENKYTIYNYIDIFD